MSVSIRDTVALTPCHWCGHDSPAALHEGSSYLEARVVIECFDGDACDARTAARNVESRGKAT